MIVDGSCSPCREELSTALRSSPPASSVLLGTSLYTSSQVPQVLSLPPCPAGGCVLSPLTSHPPFPARQPSSSLCAAQMSPPEDTSPDPAKQRGFPSLVWYFFYPTLVLFRQHALSTTKFGSFLFFPPTCNLSPVSVKSEFFFLWQMY